MFRTSLVIAMSLLAGACAVPVPPYELAVAADPSVPVPPARYAEVTAGTRTFRPVGPTGWEEHNIRVTPRAGGAN